jgi:hypothetical protein
MKQAGLLKIALKRGALLTAANWPVVLIQFTAESIFKVLVAVPILGGVFIVTLPLGRDLRELLNGDLRDIVATVASALLAQPGAFFAFLFAFTLVLLGGSVLMFLVKGGTVWVLADADRSVDRIQQPPLRWAAFQAASRYSIGNYMGGCAMLSRRFLTLGLVLIGVYLLSAAGYLVAVFGGYRWITNRTLLVAWTLVAAFLSTLLVAWVTLVNLLYLLTQIVIAVTGRGVGWSLREVFRFLRAELWDVVAVFGVILLLVVLATAASIGATAGLSMVAFVPVATLILLPLQIVAWLLRNLVFQYLGLTALTAYVHLYAPPRGEARDRWPRAVSSPHSSH